MNEEIKKIFQDELQKRTEINSIDENWKALETKLYGLMNNVGWK